MIKIKNGCPSEGIATFIMSFAVNSDRLIGKKISINKYSSSDSKNNGRRFGIIEKFGRGKIGYNFLVSYKDDNHHGEKSISAYSLRYIVDGVIH
jgi:hypothetical protein